METATQKFRPHLLSVSLRKCHLLKQPVPAQFVDVDVKANRMADLGVVACNCQFKQEKTRAETSCRRKHMLSA